MSEDGKVEIVDIKFGDKLYKNVSVDRLNPTDESSHSHPRKKRKKVKLEQIKELRLRRLQATDYLANSDVTMPDYIKTWRQTLRDLPQNNTNESQYDTLLERNTDGSLKSSVWKQPTE